uniref:Pantothenate kinase n=1 Tax=Rhabditophanes sp. KR3021 TaxID=114890 RepID=A0AC35TU64_9BILA
MISKYNKTSVGLDIGGSLTKLVYFEPFELDEIEDKLEIARHDIIRKYLMTNKAYGNTGIRDVMLQLNNVTINGRKGIIHFIRFATDSMLNFIHLAKTKGFIDMSSVVCATGGGAIKYGKLAEKEFNTKLHKSDELESLIKGIEFVAANYSDECYYYENPLDELLCCKRIWRWSLARCSSKDNHFKGVEKGELQYPYVVVNIGSGVSVLVVKSATDYTRVSGSSIGGGFFQGLCCLLSDCETFEEAIELASKGNNKNVDKLVGDIYGKGYDKMGLPEDTVAASFGKITSLNAKKDISKADLAHAALVTTTNNIGSIALNVANQYNIERTVFVGNFLRVNEIASKLLSNAMNFWSKGTKKALFLNHEGYFGAVGCLDKLLLLANNSNSIKP